MFRRDRVHAVLLADGWHECVWRDGESTFKLSHWDEVGQDSAEWREGYFRLIAPITSVLGIKERLEEPDA